jgi:hypothetical protein
MFASCVCRVLSGSGLCDGLISHSEESYRVCATCVRSTSHNTTGQMPLTSPEPLWEDNIKLLLNKLQKSALG